MVPGSWGRRTAYGQNRRCVRHAPVGRCYVLRKHAAIFRQLILGEGTMRLVVGTIIWVIVVTVIVGIVGYALDRSTARQEGKD